MKNMTATEYRHAFSAKRKLKSVTFSLGVYYVDLIKTLTENGYYLSQAEFVRHAVIDKLKADQHDIQKWLLLQQSLESFQTLSKKRC